MKLVLSRKGFDSSKKSGRIPSAILPNEKLCWFPIPSYYPDCGTPYETLSGWDVPISRLVESLSSHRIDGGTRCHLDPDLNEPQLARPRDWLPAFGSSDAAQAHLQNQGVGPGDLFLFFGWFRHVERRAESWRYVPGSPQLHVIFGWLQVGQVFHLPADAERVPEAARSHFHYEYRTRYTEHRQNNALYVARHDLSIPGVSSCLPGGGVFSRYSEQLRLTCPDQDSRSLWLLPDWFFPENGRPALSYHGKPERWDRHSSGTLLKSAHKGQEFVLDCGCYPEVFGWLGGLLRDLGNRPAVDGGEAELGTDA